MFSKGGRWLAGRIQGSKGVKKYDSFMERNPLARTALDIGGGLALGGGLGLLAKGVGSAGMIGKGVGALSRSGTAKGMLAGALAGRASGGGGGGPAGGGSDLDGQHRTAMDRLRKDFENPRATPLGNDPSQGVQYDAPESKQFSSTHRQNAANMRRQTGPIANDAMEEARGKGQFQSADRVPMNRANDPWEEIRNFRGESDDMAKQFAENGVPGGGGGGSGGGRGSSNFTPQEITASSMNAMKERADVSELMSFDPSKSFEQYMTGAQSRMADTLDKGNRNLTNSAAGGNRLNTGFFDLDAGELGRQVRQDFSNDLADKALETNQQKLSAITSGSNIRAGDLDSLRGQDLDAQRGNQNASMDAQINNARNRESAFESNSRWENAGADRDANFRMDALGFMDRADNRRLQSRNDARNLMDGDEDRYNDSFNEDREFDRESFNDHTGLLERVGGRQREDRDRDDNLFESDRDWETDMGDRDREDYESDRDFDMDRWGQQNDNRFRGGDVARGDREYEDDFRTGQQDRYLDFLSGGMDRETGRENARNQANATRGAGRNQMIGDIVGAGIGFAADRYSNRGGRGRAPQGRPAMGRPMDNTLS